MNKKFKKRLHKICVYAYKERPTYDELFHWCRDTLNIDTRKTKRAIERALELGLIQIVETVVLQYDSITTDYNYISNVVDGLIKEKNV